VLETGPGPGGGLVFAGWPEPDFKRTVAQTIAATATTAEMALLSSRIDVFIVNKTDFGLVPNGERGQGAKSKAALRAGFARTATNNSSDFAHQPAF
jgi:hypothetical protein